jgi:hypothetical protein
MKKLFLCAAIIACVTSIITSCKKDTDITSDQPAKQENKETVIAGKMWDLDSVVNIASQEKYLHTIFHLSVQKTYTNSEQNDSATITAGTWSIEGDSLKLTQSLFNEEEPGVYMIHKLSSTELVLFERYTKENKDATIEYYYKAR